MQASGMSVWLGFNILDEDAPENSFGVWELIELTDITPYPEPEPETQPDKTLDPEDPKSSDSPMNQDSPDVPNSPDADEPEYAKTLCIAIAIASVSLLF